LFFSYRLFLLIQGKTPTVHEIANKRDFLYVRQLLEKKVQEEPIIETNQVSSFSFFSFLFFFIP